MCATVCDDRLRCLGVAMGRISRFPIDLRRRPYNTLALPCECDHDQRHTAAVYSSHVNNNNANNNSRINQIS